MSKAINDLTSDSDNDSKKLRDIRDSTVTSNVNLQSSTDIDHTKSLDNSSDPYLSAHSNSILSSSRYILYPNTNNNNNSNIISISNNDIYNEHDLSSKNNTTNSIQKKMMKLCGATFSQSESALNIAKDEVMNNNINNSNSFDKR